MPNNQELKIKLLVLYDILYRKTNEENAMTSDVLEAELHTAKIKPTFPITFSRSLTIIGIDYVFIN